MGAWGVVHKGDVWNASADTLVVLRVIEKIVAYHFRWLKQIETKYGVSK